MNFNDFITKINDFSSRPLGGLTAQFKLAPEMRLQYNEEKIKARRPKKAAVLALFYPNELQQTCFLLTQRASYNGTHSAQISFPGGKIEKNDLNLAHTALREANEEVGVSQDTITVFRELTDVYIPPSNFLATPFLGYTSQRPNFITNEEVAALIEVSITDLLDDQNLSSIYMTTSYAKNIKVPCFKFQDHIVWGATAMMLSEIRELLN